MLLNEKRAFREEVGGGMWRLGIISRKRRKGFLRGGNSIFKSRVAEEEVKHLWESKGTAWHVECDRIVGNTGLCIKCETFYLFVKHFAGQVEEFRPIDAQAPKSLNMVVLVIHTSVLGPLKRFMTFCMKYLERFRCKTCLCSHL